VKWTPFSDGFLQHPRDQWAHVLIGEPPALSLEVARTRKGAQYLPCPSFVDYCRNTFVVRSPIDLSVRIRRDTYWVSVLDKDQFFYDNFMVARVPEKDSSNPLLLTMPPHILFYTEGKQSVMVESMPAFLADVPRLRGLSLVPGQFDVSKWVRAVDYTVEVPDDISEIEIREGDPLFYVRFTTADGSPVKLERGVLTDSIVTAARACANVKHVAKNKKLPELYQRAAAIISQLVKRS